MKGQLTAVYERGEKLIVAYLEEMPGVNTQGTTIEEARENLRDALETFIRGQRDLVRRRAREAEVIREPFPVEVGD